jgi:tripartite-type tricarboxylate transporter receptor subunit TctC
MKTRGAFISTVALVSVGLLIVLIKSRQPSMELVEAWPERPIRIIVPMGPGSGLDLTARLIAERLSEKWHQPVLVENRPGADGIVGVSAFLAAEPAETLLFSNTAPYVLNAFVHKSLPYDPQRDLVPLCAATEVTATIAISATLPATSLPEIIAQARERPGKLCWTAVPGFAELGFTAFLKSEGLEMTFVPYKEVAMSLQDLAQGRLHLMMVGLPVIQPLITAGKVRILATNNTKRSPFAPDLPTVAELGFPTLSFDGLFGFYGRREISSPLREKISADIQSVGSNPELVARLAATGQTASVGTPESFSARLERQRSVAARVAAMLELKPK